MQIYRIADIAEECQVSPQAVRKRCQKMVQEGTLEKRGKFFQIDEEKRSELVEWFFRYQPQPTSATDSNTDTEEQLSETVSATDTKFSQTLSATDSNTDTEENFSATDSAILEVLTAQLAEKDSQIAKLQALLEQQQETIKGLQVSNQELSTAQAKALHAQSSKELVEAEKEHLAIQKQEPVYEEPDNKPIPSLFKRLGMALRGERW